MKIEDAFREFLLRSPAVARLVGRRIFPEQAAAEQEGDRVVYALQSSSPGQSLGGDTGQPVERWELNCRSQDYDRARALAAAVEGATGGVTGGQALRSYRGWLPPRAGVAGPEDAVWVQFSRVEDGRGGEPEPAAGGEPKPWHNVALVLVIGYLRRDF